MELIAQVECVCYLWFCFTGGEQWSSLSVVWKEQHALVKAQGNSGPFGSATTVIAVTLFSHRQPLNRCTHSYLNMLIAPLSFWLGNEVLKSGTNGILKR